MTRDKFVLKYSGLLSTDKECEQFEADLRAVIDDEWEKRLRRMLTLTFAEEVRKAYRNQW